MKSETKENRKVIKQTQSSRLAGMPVRSGVKAGLTHHQAEKIGAAKAMRRFEGSRF